MKSFINDRRQKKRYDLPLKVSYCEATSNFREESLTKNICKTGLRFPVNRKIPKGSLIDLIVEDPFSNALVSSKAKVIWVDEFTSPDAEDVICEVGVSLLKKKLY